MFNNKSTTLSVSDIPCFNGCNFQGCSEKMIGVFMIATVYTVMTKKLVKPADSEKLAMLHAPTAITEQTDTTVATWLNVMWTQFNICIQPAWVNGNSQARNL